MHSEDEIIIEFTRYLKLKSISTYKSYIKDLKDFFQFKGDLFYYQADIKLCEEYRAYLLTGDKNLSKGTINNKITRVKSFYEFLFRKKIIYENPFNYLPGLKTGKSIPKNILSIDDMGKLLDSFSLRNHNDIMMKSLIEFLYGSSMRISEVCALKLDDVDFESGIIIVTDFKNDARQWKCPATEVSLKVLKKYLKTSRDKLISPEDKKNGYIYPQKSKTAIRCMLNAKLARECRRLGLKKITSHSFRHSSATHMLISGAGIRQVQAMLGHDKITSTERYTRIVKEDLKLVIENCHPREIRREE